MNFRPHPYLSRHA